MREQIIKELQGRVHLDKVYAEARLRYQRDKTGGSIDQHLLAVMIEGDPRFETLEALEQWARDEADAILPLMEKVAQAAIDASAEVSCRFDQLGNCYDAIRALSPKSIVEGVK